MPKLNRLDRSVPGARHIGDSLVARGIKLSGDFGGLGREVCARIPV